MEIKILITSGDSFSSEHPDWNNRLAEHLMVPIHNLAMPSYGNEWITRSSIHGIQTAFEKGYNSNEIFLAVLWTYPPRKLFLIDREEMYGSDLYVYDPILLKREPLPVLNPIFLDIFPFPNRTYHHVALKSFSKEETTNINEFWAVGSPGGTYEFGWYPEIDKFVKPWYDTYHSSGSELLETFNNILLLQYFCEKNNIKMLNMMAIDFFYYPDYDFHFKKIKKDICYKKYNFLKPLYDCINFDNWVMEPLLEFTEKNNYKLLDTVHPGPEAHKNFLEQHILPKIEKML